MAFIGKYLPQFSCTSSQVNAMGVFISVLAKRGTIYINQLQTYLDFFESKTNIRALSSFDWFTVLVNMCYTR